MPCPLRPIVAFIAILVSVIWAARALLQPAKEQVRSVGSSYRVHIITAQPLRRAVGDARSSVRAFSARGRFTSFTIMCRSLAALAGVGTSSQDDISDEQQRSMPQRVASMSSRHSSCSVRARSSPASRWSRRLVQRAGGAGASCSVLAQNNGVYCAAFERCRT